MSRFRAAEARRIKHGKPPRLASLRDCVTEARLCESQESSSTGTAQATIAAVSPVPTTASAATSASKTPDQLVAEAVKTLRKYTNSLAKATPTATNAAVTSAPTPAPEKVATATVAVVATTATKTYDPKTKARMSCFNCDGKGHIVSECSQPRDDARIKAASERSRQKREERKAEHMDKIVTALATKMKAEVPDAAKPVAAKPGN